MTTFSEHLRAARKAAGYTQESISEKLGIERTNYIPYETGTAFPSPKTIFRIAKALGLSPGAVLMWMAEELGE